ncbi:helix-turn-helix transcriptional regulator [Vallitalea pronyensis]|uniref:Helix-turn-helix transcriptional regulator n=1 Tax=Vallitalea pronyensis TaxID=1348613 RepID=A0A8J8MNG9_9FIRM|nr:AraC family transcriptional regulator [Vallitalea pronyensis]QUI24681.1 helix-turn-helix transcriptional regulator [Vallitalea pronyensis]
MDDKIIRQYMAHLKVDLLQSHYGKVLETWNENNEKLGYNKLYFIDKGEGLVTINHKKYMPRPGEILFIPEGSIQSLAIISPKRYVKHWCHFNGYIGTVPISQFLSFPLLKKVNDIPYVEDLFTKMSGYSNDQQAFSPIRANSLLLELLHYYFSDICKNEVNLARQVASTKINTLLTFMEQNLHRKLQTEDFAEVMNLNPNYLIRLFKTTFGTSPMNYFNRMRIEKAKELLKLDVDSISSISDKLGFNTPYYFSYVFKKHTGYSPKDYRRIT